MHGYHGAVPSLSRQDGGLAGYLAFAQVALQAVGRAAPPPIREDAWPGGTGAQSRPLADWMRGQYRHHLLKLDHEALAASNDVVNFARAMTKPGGVHPSDWFLRFGEWSQTPLSRHTMCVTREYGTKLLAAAMALERTWKPSREGLASEYERLMTTWSAETFDIEIYLPLQNLAVWLVLESTRCPSGWSLEDVSRIPKAAAFDLAALSAAGIDGWGQPIQCKAVFRKAVRLPKVRQPDFSNLLKEAEWLITGFRLARREPVGVATLVGLPTESLRGAEYIGRFVWRLDGMASADDHHMTILRDEEVPCIEEWLSRVFRLGGSGKLDEIALAIHRFHASFGRRWLDDALIDLLIAMENTLLHDMSQELTYRMSLRGAALLGRSHSPHRTSSLLRYAYGLRSKVVHGGRSVKSICGSERSAGSRVRATQRLTRRVLRELLLHFDSGMTLREVTAKLDRSILNGVTIPPSER